MNVIHAAQAGQGGPVSIACINKATVDLGVPFDKLTATQKCFDQRRLGTALHRRLIWQCHRPPAMHGEPRAARR